MSPYKVWRMLSLQLTCSGISSIFIFPIFVKLLITHKKALDAAKIYLGTEVSKALPEHVGYDVV